MWKVVPLGTGMASVWGGGWFVQANVMRGEFGPTSTTRRRSLVVKLTMPIETKRNLFIFFQQYKITKKQKHNERRTRFQLWKISNRHKRIQRITTIPHKENPNHVAALFSIFQLKEKRVHHDESLRDRIHSRWILTNFLMKTNLGWNSSLSDEKYDQETIMTFRFWKKDWFQV